MILGGLLVVAPIVAVGAAAAAAATDSSPVSGYGYGAAGILVAALLVFAGRVYWQGEKERVRVTVENARLNEARVVDARATQSVLGDAVSTLKQSAEVSQNRGRELDRLTDQVNRLSDQVAALTAVIAQRPATPRRAAPRSR